MKHDEETATKSVSIKANYPFGSIEIENVEIKPLNSTESTNDPKSKSSVPMKVIKTTVVSEIAVIGN